MKTTYRLNIYDKDGDLNEEGIFIYLGDNHIMKLSDMDELDDMICGLMRCKEELTAHEG